MVSLNVINESIKEKEYITDVSELKKRMIDKDIGTIVELSDMTGVNRNTLGLIFNGKVQPTAPVMKKLISVLGLDSDKAGEIFFKQKLTH